MTFMDMAFELGLHRTKTTKHLAKLLSSLSRSEYTVSSTDDLTNLLKQHVPANCEMIFFGVTSLFTNVPLELTIDVILWKVYDEKLVDVKIPRKEMKDLLLLCTKNIHFTFNVDIYKQLDGVAMGSPLGSVIAGIFMVRLENTMILTLGDKLILWKHYIDNFFVCSSVLWKKLKKKFLKPLMTFTKILCLHNLKRKERVWRGRKQYD